MTCNNFSKIVPTLTRYFIHLSNIEPYIFHKHMKQKKYPFQHVLFTAKIKKKFPYMAFPLFVSSKASPTVSEHNTYHIRFSHYFVKFEKLCQANSWFLCGAWPFFVSSHKSTKHSSLCKQLPLAATPHNSNAYGF